MNLKKSLVSIVLLFLVSNVLTTVWYALTDEANFVSFRREEMNYFGLMLNHIVFVLGFIYLFPYYIKDRNTKQRSFVYGVVLAAIMFIPTGIVIRSIWQVDFNLVFLMNTTAHLLIGGVLGLILNVIYNYNRKAKQVTKGI